MNGGKNVNYPLAYYLGIPVTGLWYHVYSPHRIPSCSFSLLIVGLHLYFTCTGFLLYAFLAENTATSCIRDQDVSGNLKWRENKNANNDNIYLVSHGKMLKAT